MEPRDYSNTTCPQCQQDFIFEIHQMIDLAHEPQLRLSLMGDKVNEMACPHCGYLCFMPMPILIHDDVNEKLIVYCPPELERDTWLTERIQALANAFWGLLLPNDAAEIPPYLQNAIFCHSPQDLSALLQVNVGFETIQIRCPNCQIRFPMQLRQVIDLDREPALRKGLIQDTINAADCPNCDALIKMPVPLAIRDHINEHYLIYVPTNMERNEGLDKMIQRIGLELMASIPEPYPAYMAKPLLCGSFGQLAELLLENHLDDPTAVGLSVSAAWAEIIRNLPSAHRQTLLNIMHEHNIQIGGDFNRYLADYPQLYDAIMEAMPGGSPIPAAIRPILVQLNLPENRKNVPLRIELAEKALQLASRAELGEIWATLHFNLGTDYARHPDGKTIVTLQKVVFHNQQALTYYTAEDHAQDWAAAQHNLACGLKDLTITYRAAESPAPKEATGTLDEAIDRFQQIEKAISVQTNPDLWASTNYNLGHAYTLLQEVEQNEQIPEAIKHLQEALRYYTKGTNPSLWAEIHMKLSACYRSGPSADQAADLEKVIYHYQKALEYYSFADHAQEWADIKLELARAFFHRPQGVRSENLEKSLAHYQDLANVYSPDAALDKWATVQNELANIFSKLAHGDRSANIEQAIFHYKQIKTNHSPDDSPVLWAMAQNNLANCYRNRLEGNKRENLEFALECLHQADEVSGRSIDPDAWAMRQNHLAIAYRQRLAGNKSENLQKALQHQLQALEVLNEEETPVPWAMGHIGLGNLYTELQTDEWFSNLNEAVESYTLARKVFTRERYAEQWAHLHLLNGHIFRELADRGQLEESLDKALTHYQKALTIYGVESYPRDYLETQRSLSLIYFLQQDWKSTVAAYTRAIEIGKKLFYQTYTETGRESAIAAISIYFGRVAYAHLKLGHVAEALLTLEEGKAQLLTEALSLRAGIIGSLPESQKESIQQAQQSVQYLESEAQERRQRNIGRELHEINEDIAAARQQLQAALAAAPELLPQPLQMAAILGLPQQGEALILPLFTRLGSAVFVIPAGTAQVGPENVIWLDDFSRFNLNQILQGQKGESGWLQAYMAYTNPEKKEKAGWQTMVETTCQTVWEILFSPLESILKEQEITKLILIPQAGTQLLPLHAACRVTEEGRQYLLDDYVITTAPSIRTIWAARTAVGIPAQTPRLLAVVNPTGDLAYTELEADSITSLLTETKTAVQSFVKSEARQQIIVNALAQATIFHFAGHGAYDWQDPQESQLLCADRSITLHMLQRQIKLEQLQLVCLSACESGIVDVQQSADEYVGLPAGFLQAGVPQVVSTLWAVEEISTMLLMERFYIGFFGGEAPPAALRAAQRWLREGTAEELADHFAEKRLRGLHQAADAEIAAAWRRFAAMSPAEKPFNHPYYWAAFTCTGG